MAFEKAAPPQDQTVKDLTDSLKACLKVLERYAGDELHGNAVRRAEELLRKHAPEGN